MSGLYWPLGGSAIVNFTFATTLRMEVPLAAFRRKAASSFRFFAYPCVVMRCVLGVGKYANGEGATEQAACRDLSVLALSAADVAGYDKTHTFASALSEYSSPMLTGPPLGGPSSLCKHS